MGGDRLDSEGQRTVITESMSITASDEEKLQLLNKNTELRRLNAELMKLNQQWDEIYRNTTQNLQHTARALQSEVHGLRQHIDKLSMKLEHEQHKREFYENSLLQEMKRNQKLQEDVRHLERALHYKVLSQQGAQSAASISRAHSQSDLSSASHTAFMPPHLTYKRSPSQPEEKLGQVPKSHKPARNTQSTGNISRGSQNSLGQSPNITNTEQDVNQLKDQLKALKCQTEIYAADYKTEHTDRERMKTENNKLRHKEREMREQMLMLQEQLKVYEDDFRKERSDKQVLQRLLKTRSSAHEPVLVHRCNNGSQPKGALTGSESTSGTRRNSRKQKAVDGEQQPSQYSIGY
ncbi:uncharacterized protein LOC108703288 isoform X2 [Xenopus laevis]|nr:uncharacterized protein LOC108703288 isoform X2 [Xenopus laevis]